MSAMLDSLAPDVDFEKELPEETVEEPADVVIDATEEKPEIKEEPEKPPRVDVVSQKALHEARAKEREWRDKAQKVERESNERFQKLEARLQALTNPPPAVPKFEDNPAENLKYEVEKTKAELASIRQTTQQAKSAHQSEVFEQQVAQATQTAEISFSKEHPDYLDAVKHLQTIADKNLKMMGLSDPVARQAQIRKDALAMSVKALQMGKSPAEVAYQLAQNYGYRPAEPNADAAKKIKALQAGQNSGAAMPAGGTKQTALTLATLEQMDDDEFNKLVDDPTSWSKLIKQMV